MSDIAEREKQSAQYKYVPPHLFRTIDIYCIFQVIVYTVLAIICSAEIPEYPRLIFTNVLLCGGIIGVNYALRRYGNYIFWSLRNLLLPGIILMLFLQVFYYVTAMHSRDYDAELIAADFAIFGTNPTYFIDGYAVPPLTEILQIAYVLYFFHPIAQGVELFKEKRYNELNMLMRIIVFTFLLSYLLYFIMPAVGPRFTLHDYATTNADLPGLWLTDALRLFIDSGDNVALGTANPASTVHRNCMPSGHTLVSVVNLIMAFRFKVKMRYVLAVLAALLVISTVYLRYHYVVDVLAGLALVGVVFLVEPIIHRALTRIKLCNDDLPNYL
ncbi:hypothetical protein MASR2M18_09770 [Ignavibacteria bacterium]|nr:phosphatase PAP2 family protein [Bacteroidota bacterium]MCZ2131724.1 phosphatase PAP2 family protein [Bacteroidota bacterium]